MYIFYFLPLNYINIEDLKVRLKWKIKNNKKVKKNDRNKTQSTYHKYILWYWVFEMCSLSE